MNASGLKNWSTVFLNAASRLRELGKQASHGDTRSIAAFCEAMGEACKDRHAELLSGKDPQCR